jgi:hypothetical protein
MAGAAAARSRPLTAGSPLSSCWTDFFMKWREIPIQTAK